jgi:hypothetical protein
MHALFHDGWHSITHLDGRVWRTLGLLLTKPGEVSRQFVANRRASFMPPFRLYLVISLLFFGLFGLTHNDDVISANLRTDGPGESCGDIRAQPAWFAERMRAACTKFVADGGASMRSIFLTSLPRAMFLLLPLLAAGMLLLYWRPRRYYVEHLVFYLHNHSAAFMFGAALLLLQWLAQVWPAIQTVSSAVGVAGFCWLIAYSYLAMRRFYGQGRLRTLAKLVVIGFFYFVMLAMMMVLTLVYSALTM